MPSTYTLNNGIELIGTGEQSGTWGDTTNINFQLVDTALDGQVSIALTSTGTSGSPNLLEISDGATSSGRNRLVIFTGTPGAADADVFVRLDPNDAEKIIYVRNNLDGTRVIRLFQGTYSASNDYDVPQGTTAVVFFDGAGTGAVAANVFNNAFFDSLRLGGVSVDKILDEDNMASNDAAALATQQSIKAYVDSQVGTVDTLAEILANGNTTGGTNILFGDNDKAIFGASSDLQIYHDPSGPSSLISDQGAGDLILRGSNQIRFQDATGAEHYAIFNENGAVQLYYDQGTYSDPKLATTSTGVDITGTAVTDGLTVAGNVSVDGGTIKLDGNYPNGTGNVALGDTALDTLTTGGNYNLALGHNNSTALTTGDNNVSLGAFALTSTTTSSSNTAVGYSSLELNETGAGNVALGNKSMEEGVTADNNTAVGNQAGRFLSDEIVATSIVSGVNYTIQTLGTTDFTLIGASSNTVGGTFTATGAGSGTGTASANVSLNTLVGYKSGELIIGGSKNSILGGFDGNQGGLDIRNSSNHIVLSDGDGNPRLIINASGDVGIGTSSPQGVLDLGASSSGRSLTFAKYNNIFGSYSEGSLNLTSNYYGDTTANAYKTSTTATYGAAGIEISGTGGTSTSGVIQFFVDAAAAKTADAAFVPSERMRITSAGNVGIGTSSILAAGSSYTVVDIGSSSTASLLNMTDNGTETGRIVAQSDQLHFSSGTASGSIAFRTGGFSSGDEAMRITSDGSVGINDTTPESTITVKKDVTDASIVKAYSSASNSRVSYQIGNDSDNWFMGIDGGNSDAFFIADVVSSSDRLVITQAGNVGIGITNPVQLLHVQEGGTGNGTIRVGGSAGLEISHDNSASTVQRIDSLYRTTSNDTNLQLRTGTLTFHTGTASEERMRIDFNGNLFVGTTGETLPESGTTSAHAGVSLDASDYVAAARYQNTPGFFNRIGNDGDLVQFRKNGASVGSIGTEVAETTLQADLYIHGRSTVGSTSLNDSRLWLLGGDSGIVLDGHTNAILPTDENSYESNRTDIGSANYRFKDLHLSGGVVFGATSGNVTSKTLDDYEEGTFTPVFRSVATPTYTNQTGSYTKIGRLVHVYISISYSALNTGDLSSLSINLPFTATAAGAFHIVESSTNTGYAGNNTISLIGSVGAGAASLTFGSTGNYDDGDYDSGNWAQSGVLRFAGVYPA